jgi:hypothetical protein
MQAMSMFNRDLSNLCEECQLDKTEVVKTAASFVLLVVLMSVMGWAFIPKYEVTPQIPYLTKEQAKELTINELAVQTAIINTEMEARVHANGN